MIKLINNDYRNVNLSTKFDLILTDIPYNIGKDAYASNPQWWNNKDFRSGKSEKANSKFFETDDGFNIEDFLKFCSENLKENSSVIVFCSHLQQFEMINNMKKYGFKKYIPLVFIKNNSSEVLKCNMRICGACEYGLQLFNGKFGKYNNDKKMIKNWFEMKRLSNKLHPNQKNIEILENFIKLFTDEDDAVLDPCMGSGMTGLACKNLNRNFVGIELEEKYFKIAQEILK